MRRKNKVLFRRIFISIMAIPLCLISFTLAYLLGTDGWREFDPASILRMQQSSVIFDSNGSKLVSLSAEEKRTCIKISSLPDYVKYAFISIEDARFYEHNGVDVIRIGGALVKDITSGSLSEGASTISQQVVKNAALTFDKTLSRKLTEIMMAFKLERAFSKDEILEMYLNISYFGQGAYGIEEASKTYFSKHAKDLTLPEAAALAGVLRSPSNYSPVKNKKACRARRNLVLKAMCENGFISSAEYSSSVILPLKTVKHEEEAYPCGFYTDTVLDEACSLLNISYADLLGGGYRIYTSLDRNLQEKLEELAKDDSLFPKNSSGEISECAVCVLSAKEGNILAIIGGREHTTRLAFNRACDMHRQPGSAIKPVLVFAPALEKGYTTTSFLLDQPVSYAEYSPRNAGSTYRGWVTLRDTVAYSLNIPAVKLLNELGTSYCKGYASNSGIPFDNKDYNLSLALGGFTTGVTPLELCSAYRTFASGGNYREAHMIKKIVDKNGKTVYEDNVICEHSVLSESSAFLMTSMLSSGVKYGTSKELANIGIDIAAKTGTTTYDDAANNKDAWIVAYNPEYVICTWMGFDKTDKAHSLPKGVTGGSYPASFTSKIFGFLYSNNSAPSFTVPPSVCKVEIDKKALETEFVPALAGSETAVSDRITEYYTKSTVPREYASYILPVLPRDFSVKRSGDNPLISFSTRGDMVYTLLRGSFELLSFDGNGLRAEYVDEKPTFGSTIYTLKVMPKNSSPSSSAVLTATAVYSENAQ